MTPEQIAGLEAATAAAKQKADEAGGTDETLNKALKDAEDALTKAKAAPSQNQGRSEKEKAAYTLKMNAKRLQELGGDPAAVLGQGDEAKAEDDLDKPLTLRKLGEIEREKAAKTAIELAGDIEDETERTDVISILKTRITPSGNAVADLALARAGANAVRNAKIAEEANRKGTVRRTAAGASQGGKTEDAFTPTPQEQIFMRAPYNLSKEQIIAARPKDN